MTLLWSNLGDEVRTFLAAAEDHALVVAPFVQPDALRRIIPSHVPVTVVTSWRVDHLVSGASTVETFRDCEDHGNSALFIHPTLHAKVFGRDATRLSGAILVGSANVTNRGLGLSEEGNREVLTRVEPINLQDRIALQRLVSEAAHVDKDVYRSFADWLAKEDWPRPSFENSGIPPEWPSRQFLVTDLPLTDSPSALWDLLQSPTPRQDWEVSDAVVHDLALFGGPETSSRVDFFRFVRERFFSHPFVGSFIEALGSGKYFGEMKKWVQDHCHDVPRPRRRELTATIQCLLGWIVELKPEEFELTRPSHSQHLKRHLGT